MEDDLKIPKPTTEDVIFTIGKAVVNLVPVIGGSAVEIFNFIVKTPIQKRQDQLIESIIDKIKTLEKDFEVLTPERLNQNELFISVLLKSLQAITKEHQKEKIDAFKNAVINTVTKKSISEGYKLLFLSYLESFTVLHIQIIKFFYDEFYIRNDKSGTVTNIGDKFNLFSKFNDDIEITSWTFMHIVKELDEKGLIISNRYDGPIPVADMFIAFITGYFE